MANDDRWRSQQDRSRSWDEDRRRYGDDRRGGRSGEWDRSGRQYGRYESDDGYRARRGFGNEGSGFDRGGSERRYAEDRSYGAQDTRGRGRDFGDSAGFGSGGSARDRRDVIGDRGYSPSDVFRDSNRRPTQGSWRGGQFRRDEEGWQGQDWQRQEGGRRYGGADQGYYGPDQDRGRWRNDRERGFGRESDRDMGRSREDRGFLERAGDEIRSWFGDEGAERRRRRDEREDEGGASHRGRGPRNYQRSDERIREDVSDRLTDDPTVDASEIEVTVQNREVTLSGTVQTRFEKRRAEDIAESISGVTYVQNNLRVQNQGGARVTGGTDATRGSATTAPSTIESGGTASATDTSARGGGAAAIEGTGQTGTGLEAGRRRRSPGSSST